MQQTNQAIQKPAESNEAAALLMMSYREAIAKVDAEINNRTHYVIARIATDCNNRHLLNSTPELDWLKKLLAQIEEEIRANAQRTPPGDYDSGERSPEGLRKYVEDLVKRYTEMREVEDELDAELGHLDFEDDNKHQEPENGDQWWDYINEDGHKVFNVRWNEFTLSQKSDILKSHFKHGYASARQEYEKLKQELPDLSLRLKWLQSKLKYWGEAFGAPRLRWVNFRTSHHHNFLEELFGHQMVKFRYNFEELDDEEKYGEEMDGATPLVIARCIGEANLAYVEYTFVKECLALQANPIPAAPAPPNPPAEPALLPSEGEERKKGMPLEVLAQFNRNQRLRFQREKKHAEGNEVAALLMMSREAAIEKIEADMEGFPSTLEKLIALKSLLVNIKEETRPNPNYNVRAYYASGKRSAEGVREYVEESIEFYTDRLEIEKLSSARQPAEPPKAAPAFELEKELEEMCKAENRFFKGMPMQKVVSRFRVLAEGKSNNGRPFLEPEHLVYFLQRAFLGMQEVPKPKLNCGYGEKGQIIEVFYWFFDFAIREYAEKNKKDKYVRLVTDNFDNNWSYSEVYSYCKPGKTKGNR